MDPTKNAANRVGWKILDFDRIESTNTRAAELATDRANHGLVVRAQEQSAGRGQHGRTWQCPPGSGVLMSVLLFPPPSLRRPAILTAWAAVSVCETILQTTGLQAKIKWPNDVLIHGRKACGILIEQGAGTVVGIGLNVNQPAEAFEQPGLEHGTSLSLAAGKPLVAADVAKQLIRQLDEEYDRLCSGDLATLEACWEWRLGLLGRQVAIECAETVHQGRLLEVAWSGLELETSAGGVIRLQPEAVRHVRQI